MDDQARWMTQLLEASFQSSGLSEGEVEERLGWEPGLLGRILAGTAECEPLQLLAVLAELGSESPGSLLRSRHRERGTQMVQDLIERFRGLGYGQPAAPVASATPGMQEIERAIEDILQRTFGPDLGKRERGGG